MSKARSGGGVPVWKGILSVRFVHLESCRSWRGGSSVDFVPHLDKVELTVSDFDRSGL